MTKKKNLSDYNNEELSGEFLKIGILVSEWNPEITQSLLNAAKETLLNQGVYEEDIIVKYVPGSYELTAGAMMMAKYTDVDAIICLGCVIQGETRHFDFICQAVSQGLTTVSLNYDIPVIFGVLTTNTFEQAQERAGGKHGNKGVEAAITAIKMVDFQEDLMDDFIENIDEPFNN